MTLLRIVVVAVAVTIPIVAVAQSERRGREEIDSPGQLYQQLVRFARGYENDVAFTKQLSTAVEQAQLEWTVPVANGERLTLKKPRHRLRIDVVGGDSPEVSPANFRDLTLLNEKTADWFKNARVAIQREYDVSAAEAMEGAVFIWHESIFREPKIGGSKGLEFYAPKADDCVAAFGGLALVHIDSSPAGAQVKIRGYEPWEETTCRGYVHEGEIEITLSKTGYETLSTTVNVAARKPNKLSFSLMKAD